MKNDGVFDWFRFFRVRPRDSVEDSSGFFSAGAPARRRAFVETDDAEESEEIASTSEATSGDNDDDGWGRYDDDDDEVDPVHGPSMGNARTVAREEARRRQLAAAASLQGEMERLDQRPGSGRGTIRRSNNPWGLKPVGVRQ